MASVVDSSPLLSSHRASLPTSIESEARRDSSGHSEGHSHPSGHRDSSGHSSETPNGFTSLPIPSRPVTFTPVPDLDLFLHSLYSYYLHGGYYGTISSMAVELATITVSGVAGSMVIFFVDWEKVNDCKSESTCPTSYSHYLKDSSPLLTLTSSIYLLLCLLYLLLRLHSHFLTLFRPHYNLLVMWDFYNLILLIPEKGIVSKTVSWSKVESQVMGCSGLISVVPLTPEKIRLRLSRNRNYLTGEGILLGGMLGAPRARRKVGAPEVGTPRTLLS
eukprot:CAMPEP_0182520184 /NCGR_PEP_ID=MMETSP1321-20130603/45484_1 /TAXON_ID=91990 /ORGANISM="Bolidomonas sp., Strain RCC1657" /LENGTH=274 /DNA_ID=CAMNT_0024728189 /DNA_START=247 /DNA_END=1071 /DNA_ORIENTATION=-